MGACKLHSNTYRIISNSPAFNEKLSPPPLTVNKQKLQVGHVKAFALRFAFASIVTFVKTASTLTLALAALSPSGLLQWQLRHTYICTLSHTYKRMITRKTNTQDKWKSNTDNYLCTSTQTYYVICSLLLFNYNKLYFNCSLRAINQIERLFVFVAFSLFFQLTLLLCFVFVFWFIVFVLALCKRVTKCFTVVSLFCRGGEIAYVTLCMKRAH